MRVAAGPMCDTWGARKTFIMLLLIGIPGIGNKLAQQIIKERDDRGRFGSYEDAKERICGLGDGKVELLRCYLPQCS